ncbi:MAG: DUF2220 family protein [Pirellulales bacterium]|nr:DUF2220 family protein [Pirellulales bacterium]
MKSPAELRVVLKRQWENRARREARLLGLDDAWPFVVPIGRPSPNLINADLDAVKRHVDAWRRVKIGEVVWQAVRYRAADAPVEIPTGWKIRKPSEWIEACADASVRHEFGCLATLVEQVDPMFHSLLIRRRSLWRGKPLAEVVQAAQLAKVLEPGAAKGKPLRTLSMEGIDTKFFERHGRLVTALLDLRFDDEVSQIGLETFLGAFAEGERWLLLMDLDGSLLSFAAQRVRSSELRRGVLPGKRILIVENESCQYQLPAVPGTIAVLGAGFNLSWTETRWMASKEIAYWGDIDTWGLQFLAKVRHTIGKLTALMMTSEIYEQFADSAVPEPVVAGTELPVGLTPSEQSLYKRLLEESCGRLEQEFLPEDLIHQAILAWVSGEL